jgi:hypothetical protein
MMTQLILLRSDEDSYFMGNENEDWGSDDESASKKELT